MYTQECTPCQNKGGALHSDCNMVNNMPAVQHETQGALLWMPKPPAFVFAVALGCELVTRPRRASCQCLEPGAIAAQAKDG